MLLIKPVLHKKTIQDYQEPIFDSDYPLEQVVRFKLKNKIPNDVFMCCLLDLTCFELLCAYIYINSAIIVLKYI